MDKKLQSGVKDVCKAWSSYIKNYGDARVVRAYLELTASKQILTIYCKKNHKDDLVSVLIADGWDLFGMEYRPTPHSRWEDQFKITVVYRNKE